jgi:membrane associated rhomboid family serine protease
MIDSRDSQLKFSPSVVAWPFAAIFVLWLVYWVEVRFHIYLNDYGIQPRTLVGLRGVVFSPFLHGSLEHLYNNSIPLFLLVAAMRYFYRRRALEVILYGVVFSGLFTWLTGEKGSTHIGASGLIYVLVTFIFFKGIQTGYFRLVALSLTIVLLYGSMIWYVFPDVEQGISWEGHLGGFLCGAAFSWLYETPEYKKPILYDWQRPDFDPGKDPFMKRFDENGVFRNPPKPEDIEVVDYIIVSPTPQPSIQVIYRYVANTDQGKKDV